LQPDPDLPGLTPVDFADLDLLAQLGLLDLSPQLILAVDRSYEASGGSTEEALTVADLKARPLQSGDQLGVLGSLVDRRIGHGSSPFLGFLACLVRRAVAIRPATRLYSHASLALA